MRRATILAATAAALVLIALGAARPAAQSFSAPAGSVPAPDPNVPLYFEAASVKPSNPDVPGGGIRRQPGGRFNTINTPVRLLITFAYQIQNFQLVGGPDWIGNDRFDIVAKMEGDPPPTIPGSGPDPMMLAMRTLLAERFKLVVHKETRELDVYALVLAKPGASRARLSSPRTTTANDSCSLGEAARRRGHRDQTTRSAAFVAASAAFRWAAFRCLSSQTACKGWRVEWCSTAPASPARGISC